MALKLTKKQLQASKYLTDWITDYVGYGGSAGCFSGETTVNTINGHIPISEIKEGDIVLSYNEKTKQLEYKKVEKKYSYTLGVPPKMIIFSNNLKCTYNHEFLFNGKWTKAGELRKRSLEKLRWDLLHFGQGSTCYNELEEQKGVEIDEALRIGRILQNGDSNKWSKQKHKNPSACCRSFFAKSKQLPSSKSQRFQYYKQLCRKLRMVYCKIQRNIFIKSGEVLSISKRDANGRPSNKTWGIEWMLKTYRRKSEGNKSEIQTTKIHEGDVSSRIWSESSNDKRRYSKKELDAREITLNEFIGSTIEHLDITVYDLCVADNHNYIITKENIIVHNSGKTVLGCDWLMQMCHYVSGSKYFIGRDNIKDTRASVLKTWGEVAKIYNYTRYKFTDTGIVFDNGSEIELLDLTFYPYKDPMFDRLGSKEYTAGWIEEAQQVHPLAFEVLKTRVGRWKNERAKSKILCTFNPKKNWVDTTFYRPFKNGNENPTTRFVYALPSDNPYLPKDYIKRLHELKDEATKQRLLYGNFDYDDDPTALIDFNSISEMWEKENENDGLKRITADIARYGSDKAVIMIWQGFYILDILTFDKSSTTLLQNTIRALCVKYGILMSNVVCDEDGVGGGVVDTIHCKGFVNNSSPTNSIYSNLKTECGYKLAELFFKISITKKISEEVKNAINTELGQLKTYDADKDGKLKLLPKEKIKENIGRSPDYLDNFIMRMYFEIPKKQQIISRIG